MGMFEQALEQGSKWMGQGFVLGSFGIKFHAVGICVVSMKRSMVGVGLGFALKARCFHDGLCSWE
jgi:hypothetical protein